MSLSIRANLLRWTLPLARTFADKKVFVASAFVQWLCSNTAHAATVEEAVAIGELLVASNMVHHAVDVSNVGMVF